MINLLRPMAEKIKDGVLVIYGGLPWLSLETLFN